MEEVTYDEFAKCDIRIGLITEVEIVPDADKLLRLTVEVGEKDEEGNSKPRQIVSGIREFFEDPTWLVGKRCPFIVNLKPRVIRGLESQGMILAGSEGDMFGLLIPHQDLPPGAKVL